MFTGMDENERDYLLGSLYQQERRSAVERAADCAESLYLSGWQWAQIIPYVTEHYPLSWKTVQEEIARRHERRHRRAV